MSELSSLRITQAGLAFWQSRCLLSAIELGIFTEIGLSGKTRRDIGASLNLHPRGLPDFLDGLVAMEFLEREGNGESAVYKNTVETSRFLDRNSPEYMGGYLEMASTRLFPFWSGLTETLRTGKPQNEIKDSGTPYFEELYRDKRRLELYANAMAGMSRANFQAFADAFDFTTYRTLCDIGGAGGQLSIEVARKHPHMSCISADLAPMVPFARRSVAAAGLSDRIQVVTCDMFSNPWPQADVITMGMVLHNWSVENQIALIHRAYETLPQNGSFVIIENLIDDDRRQNLFGMMMSLNMLVSCGNATDFTKREFTEWCSQAGFRQIDFVHLAGPCSAGIARKQAKA